MNEQKPSKKIVVYCPPKPEVIEKFANRVCQELARQHGEQFARSEVIDGFTDYLKLAARIYANHLNRKQEENQQV